MEYARAKSMHVQRMRKKKCKRGFVVSRDGAVVRALTSHQRGPGSVLRSGVSCGLGLLVLFPAPRGTPVENNTSPYHSPSAPITSYTSALWSGRWTRDVASQTHLHFQTNQSWKENAIGKIVCGVVMNDFHFCCHGNRAQMILLIFLVCAS